MNGYYLSGQYRSVDQRNASYPPVCNPDASTSSAYPYSFPGSTYPLHGQSSYACIHPYTRADFALPNTDPYSATSNSSGSQGLATPYDATFRGDATLGSRQGSAGSSYPSWPEQSNAQMNPYLMNTALPPIPYSSANSPYQQQQQSNPRPKIYASQLEQLPDLVSRMDALEQNSEEIIRANARRALSNSMLPGVDPREYSGYPAQRPPSRSSSQGYGSGGQANQRIWR